MSFNITPINIAADTFQIWIDRTNECINALNNWTISANNDANGSVTTGNAYMNGIFSATTIAVFTELRGGNVQSSNTLNVTSNVSFTNTVFFSNTISSTANIIGATIIANTGIRGGNTGTAGPLFVSSNVYFTNTSTLSTLSTTTTGTSAQLIDSFLLASVRAAEYIMSIKDNAANGYHAQKMIVLHDGTNVDLTEYAVVFSNASLATFSANANSTHARVYITPASANTTIKGNRIAIDI